MPFGIVRPIITPMPPPWAQSEAARRVAVTVGMCLTLGASVGVAALVSSHRAYDAARVDKIYKVGPFAFRGWPELDERGSSLHEIVMVEGSRGFHRELHVRFQSTGLGAIFESGVEPLYPVKGQTVDFGPLPQGHYTAGKMLVQDSDTGDTARVFAVRAWTDVPNTGRLAITLFDRDQNSDARNEAENVAIIRAVAASAAVDTPQMNRDETQ